MILLILSNYGKLFSSNNLIIYSLIIDPTKRPSADKLLQHKWIQKYWCSDEVAQSKIRDYLPVLDD